MHRFNRIGEKKADSLDGSSLQVVLCVSPFVCCLFFSSLVPGLYGFLFLILFF